MPAWTARRAAAAALLIAAPLAYAVAQAPATDPLGCTINYDVRLVAVPAGTQPPVYLGGAQDKPLTVDWIVQSLGAMPVITLREVVASGGKAERWVDRRVVPYLRAVEEGGRPVGGEVVTGTRLVVTGVGSAGSVLAKVLVSQTRLLDMQSVEVNGVRLEQPKLGGFNQDEASARWLPLGLEAGQPVVMRVNPGAGTDQGGNLLLVASGMPQNC
ncbi:MAG TPA: hypothetical protein VEH84_13055 [Alphaproteobacteria bacterium]|nr:hypothetical protein [Alphaproteobacteria bacterium]